jgi:hypothetical protein
MRYRSSLEVSNYRLHRSTRFLHLQAGVVDYQCVVRDRNQYLFIPRALQEHGRASVYPEKREEEVGSSGQLKNTVLVKPNLVVMSRECGNDGMGKYRKEFYSQYSCNAPPPIIPFLK